jgi:hypothetical protein
MKQSGLLGVGLKATDYTISLANILIPKNKNNFSTNGISFNQGNSYACTLFACFTLLANKFNLDFIDDEWILNKWYNDAVLHYGANPKAGWYISSAVDYARRWFNSQSDLVEKYGKVMTGFLTLPYSWALGENRNKALELFEEISRNGHDFITGHNGSKDYNIDFQSDGVLNLKKLSNPSYAHCVSISSDIQGKFDMVLDWLVINSWKGTANNIYRIEHLQDLIDNNVFFPTFYTFFSEKDEIILTGKDFDLDIKNDLVKRFNNQYIMLSNSSGAIYDIRGNKAICVDKFFQNPVDRVALIGKYEPLKLLTGISDENFISMIKK